MNPLFHQLFQQNRYMINKLNDILAEHQLYSSQWTIIFLLEQHGSMTLTAIWKYLNVEAPTVTRTVTRLEKLGWVTRESGVDKREKIIRLTEKAYARFPHIAASVQAYERKLTEHLTNEEQQQLINLLQKMKV